MNSGISDSDSGQNTKMAGLSQNQCPVYRGMTVRVMPESVSGLLRNMHKGLNSEMMLIPSEKVSAVMAVLNEDQTVPPTQNTFKEDKP